MSTEGTVHSGNVAGGNLLSQGATEVLISLVLKIRALVDWKIAAVLILSSRL